MYFFIVCNIVDNQIPRGDMSKDQFNFCSFYINPEGQYSLYLAMNPNQWSYFFM